MIAGLLGRRLMIGVDRLDYSKGLVERFKAYERFLETHPEIDPLTVRFTDLHRYVMELEGFSDDSRESNEKKLEAIQMAWHEEWTEENE
jgi:FeS assembly protein IscX